MTERLAPLDYNNEHTAEQFSDVLACAIQITDARGVEAMNFGSDIVDEAAAREGHYLSPEQAYRPNLTLARIAMSFSHTGGFYRGLTIFRPLNTEGGAAADWAGTITLLPEDTLDRHSPTIIYNLSTPNVVESVRLYSKARQQPIINEKVGAGETDALAVILEQTKDGLNLPSETSF